MIAADFVNAAALLFTAWAVGYCAGLLFRATRQLFENIVGGGG